MGARSARDDRVANREKGREGGPSSGVNPQSCKNTMREERTAIFHSVVTEDNKKKGRGRAHGDNKREIRSLWREGTVGGGARNFHTPTISL